MRNETEHVSGSGTRSNGHMQPNLPAPCPSEMRWPPADKRLINKFTGAPYNPDTSRRPTGESLSDSVQRKWKRLVKAREAHSSRSRELYADKFTYLSAARGETAPLDIINTIMGRFKAGASAMGVQLEMPKMETPEPLTAVPVRGKDGYIQYKHGQNT